MALKLGTKLGPYEILSPIGAGGMGEVYRAKDTTLGREVAIKILSGDVASDSERLQRFEREAKAVATLNHPNIVTIHGIHNENDLRFIVMELVEGETLDRMITPGGMPLAKIFDVAIPLADALAAAHEKGIVHRDLKPGNVMVTKEGRVKVLDFGLAKLTAAGQGGSSPDAVTMSAPLTARGMIMGTVPYMSPEQLRTEVVDHRTDLFSLGIMLYEMATGQRPFKGEELADVMSSILRDAPRPLHELNSVLPRHLGRIIEHSLEKDPEQRFQSAKDVRNELRALQKEVDSGSDDSEPVSTPATPAGPPTATPSTTASGSAMSAPARRGELWIGVGVIAIILIAGFWFMRPDTKSLTSRLRTERGIDSSAITSLAVLPFANDSGDTDADFLCDGIAESVINRLSAIPELRVISRNTAFRYRGRENELDKVARELNVRSVLTGRVLKRGEHLVVSVALEDMDSHQQLWGERFDRELKDILILEREISERITDALRLTVGGKERQGRHKPDTENPEARLAYMQGRYWWSKRTLNGFEKSLEHYDRAVEFDPDYALAYAGKAATYAMMSVYTHPPREVMPLAERAAERAIELNPMLAEAHTSLGWIRATYDWDWEGAAQSFQKAIQLNPRYATAHHWYGWLLYFLGRVDESQREFEAALRLDPQSLIICTNQGWPHMSRGHINLAVEASQRTIEMDASFPHAHFDLGMAYLAKRQYEHAIQEFGTALSLAPDTTNYDGLVGFALGLAGRRTEALAELDTLEQASRKRYVPFAAFGLIHTGLGNRDRAFEYLNRACDAREILMMRLKVARIFDPLRHDPRFDMLLERVGFPSDPPAPVVEPWQPQQIRLAVLPFENVSSDADTEYLSNEIPASIIDKLSGLSGLRVISRSGAFRFDPSKEDASSFGRSLDASVVLTGQLNARGNNLMIRAELVDVATNEQLWSKRYPRELTDIMAVEADITQNIAAALRLELTQEERTKLAKDDTKNADAYRALLEGRFWFQKFTVAGWRRALGHFQDAVRIDPKYAVAHAELSNVYGALGVWFGDMPPDEAGPKAKQAAAMAIALDDTLGEAHGALALNRLFYDWDWPGAEEEFLRSISRAPESGEMHRQYSILLRVTGRSPEAEEVIKVAQQLDPTFPMNFVALGATYVFMGRYEEGIEQCKKALDLDPQFPPAYLILGHLYLAKGMYAEAISHFEKNSLLRNRQTGDLGYLGSAYALAGQRTKALGVLNELRDISSNGRGQVAAAMIDACLGNVDAAFASLEQAYRQRDPALIWLSRALQLAPLRGDLRFDELLRRIGLKPESQSPSTFTAQNRKTMLVVLPFKNLSDDPEQEYFSDGMTEEMITRLGRLRPKLLGVIARTSAMRYKNTNKTIDEIGRELNVAYVIEGGVRRSGDRVRINAQLIQVSDQTQLWGDSFTRDLSDVFAIQAEVAEAVAKSLAMELLPDVRTALKEAPTDDSAAHDAYLLGRHYWSRRTADDLETAITHFQRAIEIDPGYALAYAGLSDVYSVLPGYKRVASKEVIQQSRDAAQRALAINADLAEAQAAMGNALFSSSDYANALHHFRKAIELNPNYATARQWYSECLANMGHREESIQQARIAVELDPQSPVISCVLGFNLSFARRFDDAIAQARLTVELAPRWVWGHRLLAESCEHAGRYEEAVEAFQKAARLSGTKESEVQELGAAFSVAGIRGVYEWFENQLKTTTPRPYYPLMAVVAARLGKTDEAFKHMNDAIEAHDQLSKTIAVDPYFDNLRDDPRFDDLLRKMGLGNVNPTIPATAP